MRDNLPETDDEAKVRLPQDIRLQGLYDQLRQAGKSPSDAFNAVIQQQWSHKKSVHRPDQFPITSITKPS